jgi:integrase
MTTAFRDRPIADVTKADAVRLIRTEAARKKSTTFLLLSYCKSLFTWAIDQEIYGIEVSPFAGIKAAIIGERVQRDRVLEDVELRALWAASASLGYPLGPFVRFLLITGQRLRECANMVWAEVNLDTGLWLIPAARMKTGIAHEVPLSGLAVDLLRSLPRFPDSPFVFTATGRGPLAGFSVAKARVDRAAGPDVAPWRFHDIRRSVRTGLGGLPVPTNVAEMVIGHQQPGIHRVYDRHSYRNEKRQALELWSRRLLSIVEPAESDNIIPLAMRQ